MSEMEEQAEKLMFQRIQEVREAYGLKQSKTYDLEMKENVARMDRVLHSLSDQDQEWLDNQMMDRFCAAEQECQELYMAGFRDAMRLMMAVGL